MPERRIKMAAAVARSAAPSKEMSDLLSRLSMFSKGARPPRNAPLHSDTQHAGQVRRVTPQLAPPRAAGVKSSDNPQDLKAALGERRLNSARGP